MDKEINEKYLKETNDRIYEQLSFAETKHAVLIGFISAAIFAIVGIIIDLKDAYLLWLQIWLGAIAAMLLIPLIVSILAIYPKRSTLNREAKNLYFYGDIAKFSDAESYLGELNKDPDLKIQIAEQNIQVSQIVSKKHDRFSLAINLCLASLIPLHYIGTIILFTKKKK